MKKSKDELKVARTKNKVWLICGVSAIWGIEITLMFSFLAIVAGINSIDYQLRSFLGIAITTLMICANILTTVISRAIKIDIFDMHCDDSIAEIDRQITGLVRLRNEIAVIRQCENKITVNFEE